VTDRPDLPLLSNDTDSAAHHRFASANAIAEEGVNVNPSLRDAKNDTYSMRDAEVLAVLAL
jgi:hypothetical protein